MQPHSCLIVANDAIVSFNHPAKFQGLKRRLKKEDVQKILKGRFREKFRGSEQFFWDYILNTK